MKEYVTTSLKIHLFFTRIRREHVRFLLAAFPTGETGDRKKADWFREQFEKVLEHTVRLGDGIAGEDVLCSGEVFTEFTEATEQYGDFKAAGSEGITGCGVRSVILPLLADHVLGEANHYLPIVKNEGRQ